MSRIIYINGTYHAYHKASLHVEDRATLFADSIYEVIEVKNGQRVDEQGHLTRLSRSLNELQITPDFSLSALPVLIKEIIRRNKVRDGFVYIQISRGTAKRDFFFPDPKETPTTLVLFARSRNMYKVENSAAKGIKVITTTDLRWARPDIKSTALVASVLARQAAKEQSAQEAWLYNENEEITEGAASNAWIINKQRELITHPADHQILKGITREGVMRAAAAHNLKYSERPFTIKEAKNAQEAFISAATALIMPVVQIDDALINNGEPGPITLKLRSTFHEFALMKG